MAQFGTGSMSQSRASNGPERPSYWRLVAQIVRGGG